MPVIQTGLFSVLNRFPEHGEAAKQLFKKDSNFQSVCLDYIQCRQALQYWQKSDTTQARGRQREYAELLEELEEEILEALDKQ